MKCSMGAMNVVESVLVEILIPATDEVFDFLLPATGIIQEMAAQIADTLEHTGRNIVFDRTALMLCAIDSTAMPPRILFDNATLQASGITDGSRLMLL